MNRIPNVTQTQAMPQFSSFEMNNRLMTAQLCVAAGSLQKDSFTTTA